MNKRQLAAMAAAAMMSICMPTTAFAGAGQAGPAVSQRPAAGKVGAQGYQKERQGNRGRDCKVAAADAGERQQGAQGRRPCRA